MLSPASEPSLASESPVEDYQVSNRKVASVVPLQLQIRKMSRQWLELSLWPGVLLMFYLLYYLFCEENQNQFPSSNKSIFVTLFSWTHQWYIIKTIDKPK